MASPTLSAKVTEPDPVSDHESTASVDVTKRAESPLKPMTVEDALTFVCNHTPRRASDVHHTCCERCRTRARIPWCVDGDKCSQCKLLDENQWKALLQGRRLNAKKVDYKAKAKVHVDLTLPSTSKPAADVPEASSKQPVKRSARRGVPRGLASKKRRRAVSPSPSECQQEFAVTAQSLGVASMREILAGGDAIPILSDYGFHQSTSVLATQPQHFDMPIHQVSRMAELLQAEQNKLMARAAASKAIEQAHQESRPASSSSFGGGLDSESDDDDTATATPFTSPLGSESDDSTAFVPAHSSKYRSLMEPMVPITPPAPPAFAVKAPVTEEGDPPSLRNVLAFIAQETALKTKTMRREDQFKCEASILKGTTVPPLERINLTTNPLLKSFLRGRHTEVANLFSQQQKKWGRVYPSAGLHVKTGVYAPADDVWSLKPPGPPPGFDAWLPRMQSNHTISLPYSDIMVLEESSRAMSQIAGVADAALAAFGSSFPREWSEPLCIESAMISFLAKSLVDLTKLATFQSSTYFQVCDDDCSPCLLT